jgi:hypothetical protein
LIDTSKQRFSKRVDRHIKSEMLRRSCEDGDKRNHFQKSERTIERHIKTEMIVDQHIKTKILWRSFKDGDKWYQLFEVICL